MFAYHFLMWVLCKWILCSKYSLLLIILWGNPRKFDFNFQVTSNYMPRISFLPCFYQYRLSISLKGIFQWANLDLSCHNFLNRCRYQSFILNAHSTARQKEINREIIIFEAKKQLGSFLQHFHCNLSYKCRSDHYSNLSFE